MDQKQIDTIAVMINAADEARTMLVIQPAMVRALIGEIIRLKVEVNALENKQMNAYLDRELENERLQGEIERLSATPTPPDEREALAEQLIGIVEEQHVLISEILEMLPESPVTPEIRAKMNNIISGVRRIKLNVKLGVK